MQISSAWSRGRFEVHCSTGVSPGTLFWDARSGRETSFTLPLPALPSPLSLLPLFSNGGETGHSFSRYKLADQRLHNLWVFPRWTKGNGWRERERKVSSSAFRANIAGNSAGVPNCPRFAYAPGFVSQGKRNEREKASSSLPIAKNNFFVGCSFSRSLSRRDLFSRKTIPS